MAMCTGLIRKGERLEENVIGEIVAASPSEVHWNVPRFCSLPQTGYFFKSPPFLFIDGEWCLAFSPDGNYTHEILWLRLERIHSPSNCTIKFREGIKAKSGTEICGIQTHDFKFDGDKATIKLPVEMKTTFFRKHMAPGEEVTFFCNFLSSFSESESSQNRPSKGADKVIEIFEELFLSGEHHDIIIKVQEEEIRAHKLIIVARCPVFASMFRHDTIERNTGLVTIEDCDPEVFRVFLSFLYTGKLKNVSAENVIELYVIADKYQVDEVKSECVEFMMRGMSDESFCDFISLALRHSERDLLNFATNYFVKNVKTIILTVKWQSFHKEYPVESNELYIKAINRLSPD